MYVLFCLYFQVFISKATSHLFIPITPVTSSNSFIVPVLTPHLRPTYYTCTLTHYLHPLSHLYSHYLLSLSHLCIPSKLPFLHTCSLPANFTPSHLHHFA